MSKKKILITGGNGFIGKNIKEFLIKKDYEVYAPSSKELDLLNQNDVCLYLNNNHFDVVIHSAKTKSVGNIDYNPVDINLRMFLNLEKYNALYDKMLYFGSGAEYHRTKLNPNVKETDFGTYIPEDDYGIIKYMMRRLSDIDNNIYDLCIFGVFGKYEDYTRRFISNNIVNGLKNSSIIVHNNAIFDYLYIDDLSKIVEWFIEHKPKNKQYNVCTGYGMELIDIANIINEKLGNNCSIKVEKSSVFPIYTGDNSLLLNELNDFEFTPMGESIKELTEYYKSIIKDI